MAIIEGEAVLRPVRLLPPTIDVVGSSNNPSGECRISVSEPAIKEPLKWIDVSEEEMKCKTGIIWGPDLDFTEEEIWMETDSPMVQNDKILPSGGIRKQLTLFE